MGGVNGGGPLMNEVSENDISYVSLAAVEVTMMNTRVYKTTSTGVEASRSTHKTGIRAYAGVSVEDNVFVNPVGYYTAGQGDKVIQIINSPNGVTQRVAIKNNIF